MSLIGAALLTAIYLVVDGFWPRYRPAVVVIQNYRRHWERFYGWTYVERWTAAAPAPPTARVGSFLTHRFAVHDLFQAKLGQAGVTVGPELFVFWHLTAIATTGYAAYYFGGLALAVVVVAVGAAAPLMILPVLARRQRTRVEEQLADTLQLVASLLRAGHGLPQALAAVAKESQPPISLGLRKALAELNLGGSLEAGLAKMATEVGSVTLGWVVTAIKIQREVGGNLSELMETLARSIRERAELTRQVRALTAEGRLSALILLGLPLILAAVLSMTNPGYMALLWTTTPGRLMVALAIAMMLVGTIWLQKIVRVEV